MNPQFMLGRASGMDEVIRANTNSTSGSVSRRAALKAGVAAGVGAVAWSGATITSLGGTPAYAAAGCTGIINLDLSGGCRNTDRSSSCTPPANATWRYHTLKTDQPAGFSIVNNPGEGTCCDDVSPSPILAWTGLPNLTCVVHVEFYDGGFDKCRDRNQGNLLQAQTFNGSSGAAGTGSVSIPLACLPFDPPSNTFYTIFANCGTTGAPPQCL